MSGVVPCYRNSKSDSHSILLPHNSIWAEIRQNDSSIMRVSHAGQHRGTMLHWLIFLLTCGLTLIQSWVIRPTQGRLFSPWEHESAAYSTAVLLNRLSRPTGLCERTMSEITCRIPKVCGLSCLYLKSQGLTLKSLCRKKVNGTGSCKTCPPLLLLLNQFLILKTVPL